MIGIRKDLNITKPTCYNNENLEVIYDIHFEFTYGEHNSVQVENIATLDTESSNGFMLPDRHVIAFDQKKYDRGVTKTHNKLSSEIDETDEDVRYMRLIDNVALPVGLGYLWQTAIEDGTGGISTFVGRTWEQFFDFQLKLVNEIRRQCFFGFDAVDRPLETIRAREATNKKDKKKGSKKRIKLCWFVHNLGHDWHFLLNLYEKEFSNSRRKGGSVFARKPKKPIKASMYLDGVINEYRDTLIYFQKSLKYVAKDHPACPLEKLEDYNYLKLRTPYDDDLTDEEIHYALNDVLILAYVMAAERDEYGGVANLPLTNTGKVRRIMQDNVCRKNPYWTYNCSHITKNYDYDEYKKRIALYSGGFTHACNLHIGEVIGVDKNGNYDYSCLCYDFNSSYPSVLCNGRYPIMGYEPCDVKEFDDLQAQDVEEPDYRFFFKARFTKIHSIKAHTYWSSSKCVSMEGICCDNGRIYSAKEMTVYMTDLDWYSFKQMYKWDTMEVLELQKGIADYLPKELILTILDLYNKKTKLRGLDDRLSEYQSAKVAINSTYGCFAYRQIADVVTFTPDGWNTQKLCDGGVHMFYDLLKEVNEDNAFGFLDLGIICSSIARKRLFDFIIKFDDRVVYSDTDSIKGQFTQNDLDFIDNYNKWIEDLENRVAAKVGFDPDLFNPADPKGNHKRLGLLDKEQSCCLKTLGAKRYASLYPDGTFKTTIAGLPKSAGTDKIKSFDDFSDNTFWTTEEAKKVCCYYQDNQPEGQIWIGSTGKAYISDDKYGVCLKPVTFDLSMSGEFKEFLNLLATGIIDRDSPYYTDTPFTLMLHDI